MTLFKWLFAFLGFLSINAIGCAQDKSNSISVAELRNEIKNDSSLVILDVRTPQELRGPLGQIEGVINIPVQELESRIGELDKYRSRNIAVICRTGNRSAAAQEILSKYGIKSKNVKGGMTEYRASEK